MASISVNHGLGNPAQQLVNHDALMLLGNTVKCLLDHVAAKWVHAEAQSIASNRIGDGDNLIGRSVLEAALNQEVSEAVDHEGVSLVCNGLDNIVLLLSSANLELLLQED